MLDFTTIRPFDYSLQKDFMVNFSNKSRVAWGHDIELMDYEAWCRSG